MCTKYLMIVVSDSLRGRGQNRSNAYFPEKQTFIFKTFTQFIFTIHFIQFMEPVNYFHTVEFGCYYSNIICSFFFLIHCTATVTLKLAGMTQSPTYVRPLNTISQFPDRASPRKSFIQTIFRTLLGE